ncbi:MAG TPA: methyltransferase domain-containing protein [Solirubrobacteraceae bacterium]|nr:methyltransferase domain-containing protein [Solirubrobacteraceae bacterium]
MTELPPPAVPPEAYTEQYYRERCMGAERWDASDGATADPLYFHYTRLAGVRAGEVVVDVGCGRGELLVAALRAGAARAVGVEYAEAALALARRTVEAAGLAGAEVHRADARALPLDDATADVVTMLDVVEHLSPTELAGALAEARRVLRPGGRLLAHTMPTSTIYAVTYRALRAARPRRWTAWPPDPRHELERAMHVNEQSLWSLRRILRRAGFAGVQVTLGRFIYTDHLPEEPARRTAHRLASHRPTAPLGRADLWARAVRPPPPYDARPR